MDKNKPQGFFNLIGNFFTGGGDEAPPSITDSYYNNKKKKFNVKISDEEENDKNLPPLEVFDQEDEEKNENNFIAINDDNEDENVNPNNRNINKNKNSNIKNVYSEREVLIPEKKAKNLITNNQYNQKHSSHLLGDNNYENDLLNADHIKIDIVDSEIKEEKKIDQETTKIISAINQGVKVTIKKNDFDKYNKRNKIYCHRILRKGEIINIKNFDIFHIKKFAKIPNFSEIFSFFGKSNNTKAEHDYELKNYILFFHENFLYFSEDKLINKKEIALRRIKSKYNFHSIKNFKCVLENNNNIYNDINNLNNRNYDSGEKYRVEIEIEKGNNNDENNIESNENNGVKLGIKIKKFIIDKIDYWKFNQMMKRYINFYKGDNEE